MKLVIQRVKNASVEVDKKIVGKIEKGFLVLIGIKVGDTKEQADYLVRKPANNAPINPEETALAESYAMILANV